jgi:hypothetical protein
VLSGVIEVAQRSATAAGRDNRKLLVLWGFIAGLGFAATAWLCAVSGDVASSARLGVPGTQIVMGAAFAVTVWGVVVAWPVDVSARVRRMAVVILVAAVCATAVPTIGLLASGEYTGMGIVLLQSVIFVAVVAGRVYESSKDGPNRSVARP